LIVVRCKQLQAGDLEMDLVEVAAVAAAAAELLLGLYR
jgi:hypothetical protein